MFRPMRVKSKNLSARVQHVRCLARSLPHVLVAGVMFALVFCSKGRAVVEPSGPERGTSAMEAYQKADGSVSATLLDRASEQPIYKFEIPFQAFRSLTEAHRLDLQDGVFEGKTLRLNAVYGDGHFMLPKEAAGKTVQSILYITVESTTDGYNDRIRYMWDSDVDPSNLRKRSGDIKYDAERIILPGTRQGEQEVYLAEDAEFGLVLISCRGALQSDGSFVMAHGKCAASFEPKPKMIVSVSFHQSLRAHWHEIVGSTVDAIFQWEVD